MVGAQRFHSRCAVHLLSFMMQSETVDANKTEKKIQTDLSSQET